MRKLFAAFVIGSLSLLGTPAAQADDDTVIDYFTGENVSAVMKELGATNIETKTDAKVTYVIAEINGYNVSLGIEQCEGHPGCMGLLVAAVFAAEGKQWSAQTLVEFTGKYPPTPALQLSEGRVALARAVISLGGIRTGNLKYNIGLLIGTLPVFAQHLNTALVASNQYGPAPARAMVRSVPMAPAEMRNQLQALTASMAAELARWPAPIRHR